MMRGLRSTVGTRIFIVEGTDLTIHHGDLINLLVHVVMPAKPLAVVQLPFDRLQPDLGGAINILGEVESGFFLLF